MDNIFPNLFVVGAPKCGTTFMYHLLSQHQEIFMSAVKEPRYFSDDLRQQGLFFHEKVRKSLRYRFSNALSRFNLASPASRMDPAKILGIASLTQYLDLFSKADRTLHKYAGEASPDYMWSANAAANILSFNPSSRIIIMLRNPIDYIAAIHAESLKGRVGENVSTVKHALRLEKVRRKGFWVPSTVRYPFSVLYKAQARFDIQAARYLDVFPRHHVHIVIMEDLRDDPARTAKNVFDFLNLKQPASHLDLAPRNASTPNQSGTISSRLRKALTRDFKRPMERLSKLTGIDLIERWAFH